jgi:hypothetical protein
MRMLQALRHSSISRSAPQEPLSCGLAAHCALRRAGEAAVARESRDHFTEVFELAADRAARAVLRPLARLAAVAEPAAVMAALRSSAESHSKFCDRLFDPLLALYRKTLLQFGFELAPLPLGQGRQLLAALEADLQSAAAGGAKRLADRLAELSESYARQTAREMLSSVDGRK